MKKILLTTCLCILAAPVFAQGGSTITIIHEDGSKDVIDLGTSAKPAPEAAVPEAAPEVIPEPAPASEPVPEVAAEPAPVDAPKASVEAVPVVEPEPEPVAEPAPESKPVPKKAAAPKPVQKAVKKADVPKPRRKPYRAVEGDVPAEVAAPQVPAAISKDKAVYIALEAAPPARDVEVIERVNEYAVLFKTEEGVYEVLVDRQSGVILSTQMLENVRNTVPPGHLPARVNLPKN